MRSTDRVIWKKVDDSSLFLTSVFFVIVVLAVFVMKDQNGAGMRLELSLVFTGAIIMHPP